ncbi:MAG: hypothetical protein HLUCCA01_03895 [Bacteroidetes bacterium HLUCCA01]|nr:MAG: hypothetical protein HLUCCA01_03895 [Bacteroidetes bacterium HLUCCA01]
MTAKNNLHDAPFVGVILRYVVLLTAGWLLTSCTPAGPQPVDEPVLARVGDQVITAREFQLNYEFGYPHLLPAEHRREAYLNHMITEVLLARRGYELQLDTVAAVQRAVQTLREERIIEEVFNHFVLSQIEITPEEIEHEVNKSAVSVEFKFLPAPGRLQALQLRDELRDEPFETVAARYASDVFNLSPDQVDEFFTHDRTPAVELDPELLGHLQDLEINTPSDPVFYNNQWFVFMVSNIVQARLTPLDRANRSVSARKVLYNTKAMQQAAVFVNDRMSPLQVETSREVFNAIVPHLFDLYKQDTPSGTLWERIRQADASQPELEAIRTLADQTLIYTESGNWSVQRFFSTFNTGRYPLRADGSMQDFSLRFSDIVALVVRDDVFLDLAARENLHERAEVQRDIRRWQDKWVYHQTRDRMLDTLRFDQEVVTEFVTGIQSPYSDRIRAGSPETWSEESLRRFRRDYLARSLTDAAASLKDRYPVYINETMLDTLTLSESRANPNMTLQVFKQNSNRMAWPVLDPIW